MMANKIEMVANVVSGLAPNIDALGRAMALANLEALRFVPAVIASARAVLTEKQMENGACVIDFGSATTSIAVYDEGDLQYLGVVPAGANNITKDLAISLELNTEVAEEIKLRFVTPDFAETGKEVTLRHAGETISFSQDEVNMIVKERIVDIFAHIDEHLKRAGYAQKLPEGAVIVGAGAKIKGLAGLAKEQLKMATRIGVPGAGLSGIIEDIERPEYAAAIGLAQMMADDGRFSGMSDAGEKKPLNLLGFLKKRK